MTPTGQPKIALAAGGTAGHIYPALAVADVMRRRGWEVVFLGTHHGREQQSLRNADYELLLLPGAPYHRTSRAGRISALFTVPLAIASAARQLLARRIDAVIGFGGYASVGVLRTLGGVPRRGSLVRPRGTGGGTPPAQPAGTPAFHCARRKEC